jgi:hypothetical protein
MGRDKRGVSASVLQRELAVAYQTVWTMAHKLRHGHEDPTRVLRGFLRRTRPSSAAEAMRQVPDAARSTLTRVRLSCRVRRCRRRRTRTENTATPKPARVFAGNARIAVLPVATGAELGAFLKAERCGRVSLTEGLLAIAAATPARRA